MAERLHLARSYTVRTVNHQPRQHTLQTRYSSRRLHCLYVDCSHCIGDDDPGLPVRTIQPYEI